MVSLKVNIANTESVPQGGFYLRRANSKLYFECLKIFSVPGKNLPLRGKTLPKSAFLTNLQYLTACSTMYH